MPLNAHASLYNLIDFTDTCFLPWTERLESPSDAAHALEALLWLHLGVMTGAFPRTPSRALAESAADRVQHAFENQRYLKPLFAEYHWEVLRTSLQGRRFFETDWAGYVGSGDLAAPYQAALNLALHSWDDPETTKACRLLTFAEPDEWDVAVLVARTRADGEVVPNPSVEHPEDLLQTLIEMLAYVIDLDRFSSGLLADDSLNRALAIALVGDVSAIQGWRLNLGTAAVVERFYEGVSLAWQSLPERPELPDAELRRDFDSLVERWSQRAKAVDQALQLEP